MSSDDGDIELNQISELNHISIGLGRILYRKRDDLKRKIKLFFDDTDRDELETDIDSDIEPEPTEKHICSLSHDRSCQIEFENESSISIYCYWIRYDCNVHKPPHIIYPYSSLRLNTYISHPFIISTSDSLNAYNYDTVIAVYIPLNHNYSIHHILIHQNLTEITVNPFDEEIKPRCKCGRILQEKQINNNDNNNINNGNDVYCFGCDRYIADGDRIWICDNIDIHKNKKKQYCLQCAQQRSQPLAIIFAYSSNINTDFCCNQKYKNYPRQFPRLFKIHQFIENILRILSLSTDIILLYLLFNNNNSLNLHYLSYLEILRIIFTFLPGLICCILALISYHIQNGCGYICKYFCFCCKKQSDDEEIDNDDLSPSDKRKECLKTICIILALISLIFLYKILMIGLCIFRLIFILTKVKHFESISSDVEIKHIFFLYPLLYDAILSSWPLFVICLIESTEIIELFNYICLIKVITMIILIFIDIDELRLWRYCIYDSKMLVPVCILHTMRPYPMRTMKTDKVGICVICGCQTCKENVWFCAHSNCNHNIICMECAWSYLSKYQQHQDIDDEEFYQQLLGSKQFMKIYGEQIENYAKRNKLGNIQKHCWSELGFFIWSIKVIYNIYQIYLLIIGVCLIFQKVWLFGYFNIDNKYIFNITTIYGSLFLCISLIFQLILIIIHITFLFPNSKIQRSVPRIIFNLFFVFYLFGFSLLLFDYKQLSSLHILIKYSLIGFILQLCILPFLSIWQIYQSNAYLWQ